MSGSERETATGAALSMISAFASVGATVFDLSITNLEQKKVEGLQRPGRSLETIRQIIGSVLQHSERHRHNVIIRPRSATATLIQLDDLDEAKAERIAPHSFIVFQTSPGNYQAWVAVEKGAPEDVRRRLLKGIGGADKSASGSTRIAGSLNFKPDYAPSFPRVQITRANPGSITSTTALQLAGVLAQHEQPAQTDAAADRQTGAGSRGARYNQNSGWKQWPSWEMCLRKAPESKSRPGKPRESPADFMFCLIAAQWGFSVEATADHLMEVSPKAKDNGYAYAFKTATRAAEAAQRNPYRARSTPRPA